MCLRFKFCTHHRVCVLNFLLKSQIRCTLLYSFAGDLYFFKLTQPLTLSVKKKGEKPDRNPYPLPYGLRTETSSQRTLKIMSRNRNVIVRSWIRLLYKSHNMCRLVHGERDTLQMFFFIWLKEGHTNRCKRISNRCRTTDLACLRKPVSVSFNFMSLISKLQVRHSCLHSPVFHTNR